MNRFFMNLAAALLLALSLEAGDALSSAHLTSLTPAPSAAGVKADTSILAVFDLPVAADSVESETVTLSDSSLTRIAGSVSVQNNSVRFIPDEKLKSGSYQVKIKQITLEGPLEISKPTNPFGRFVYWLCSLFYSNVSDCPLCRYFCTAVPKKIYTEPIEYSFTVHAEPKIEELSLELPVTEMLKDNNTTLTLTALYDDNSTEDVTTKAEWIITPKDAVTIYGRTLTAKLDTSVTIQAELNATRSNPVTLEIYWEVNGHRLPPEPDPKINNATLLGVDVNDNGVRDDVERWIYKTYSHPIERAAFMQLAKALQYRMGHADEAWKYRQPTSDAVTCFSYWSIVVKYIGLEKYQMIQREKNIELTDEIDSVQYNTKLRKTDNKEYQKALSGGVIEDNGLEPEEWIQKCDFNATELMKDHQ